MTEALQSGQFHTGSTDTPATEPSIFQAAANPAQSAIDAEVVVTERLAEAAGEAKTEGEPPEVEPEAKSAKATATSTSKEDDEVEYEEVAIEDLTVPELKEELDKAGVDYPSDARKPELVKLVEKL